VDNIKMDIVELGWGWVDWIGLAQDRHKWWALVNVAVDLRVPCNAWNLSSDCTIGGLSNSAQLYRISNWWNSLPVPSTLKIEAIVYPKHLSLSLDFKALYPEINNPS
jgi:hypothetical protein